MATIVTRQAKSWVKCAACSEQVTTLNKYLQVVNDNGKDARGERYCPRCEKYARMNNDISDCASDDDNDGESFLRERETYAAYQAAGCTSDYFNDKNAGYHS